MRIEDGIEFSRERLRDWLRVIENRIHAERPCVVHGMGSHAACHGRAQHFGDLRCRPADSAMRAVDENLLPGFQVRSPG